MTKFKMIKEMKLNLLLLETYADDSRIPEMSFGTPIEDAMRRDLTIDRKSVV